MEIKTFVEAIKNDGENAIVPNIITVKKYASSTEKVNVAKQVIDLSVEYDRGFVKFDSYKKHLAFLFGVIESHTDLRFADNWSDKIQEYDMLCENELVDVIIDTFRKDYEASLEVLDMMCNDMAADNSIEASVAKVAQTIAENLDVLIGSLADKIENTDVEKIIPKDLDLNKLMGLLGKIK
jgi:hypothetical protein